MLQQFIFNLVSIVGEGGLGNLGNSIIQNWIGPVFLVGVAAFAIIFIKDRAWMKLVGFVGIAAIVGILIFAGGSLFGGSNSVLVGAAKQEAEKVSKNGGGYKNIKEGNTIVIPDFMPER